MNNKYTLQILIAALAMVVSMTSKAECSAATFDVPSFCVGERVLADLYPISSGSDHHFRETTITQIIGGSFSLDGVSQLLSFQWISKIKGCGKSTPRYCVGEQVRVDLYPNISGSEHVVKDSIIVGLNSKGYVLSGRDGYWETKWLGKTRGCGTTKPAYCVGEIVAVDTYGYESSEHTTLQGEITGIFYSGYSLNGRSHIWETTWLKKTLNGCRKFPGNVCPGNIGMSSLVNTESLPSNLNEIAQVVPEIKAKLFRRLAEESSRLQSENINRMLIVLSYAFLKNSTSQILQTGFLPEYQKAVGTLPKGFQDLSEYTPNVENIQIAMLIMRSAVEMDINSATPSEFGQTMMGSLAGIQAEPRFSMRLIRLQGFINQYSEVLLASIQDPHNAGMAGMTQVILSWLSQQ
jgi:hypothetical protein